MDWGNGGADDAGFRIDVSSAQADAKALALAKEAEQVRRAVAAQMAEATRRRWPSLAVVRFHRRSISSVSRSSLARAGSTPSDADLRCQTEKD